MFPRLGPLSALFVGNSLTSCNDLPAKLQGFVAASPLHVSLTVRSCTPGGATLAEHWQKGEVVRALRMQSPDFVILQGHSLEPLTATDDFVYYATLFKAEADRVHSTMVLFCTWARPEGDEFYQHPTSGGSAAEMQRRLNEAYSSLSGRLGTDLAPIGLAWELAAREAPGIELLDGTQHPSLAGTYLAAAILFRSLFHTSIVCNSFRGGLPEPVAFALQRVAADAPGIESSLMMVKEPSLTE